MKTMLLPTILALGAALLSAQPAQAQTTDFFVTIDGARQGPFHGGSTQTGHKNDILGLKYNYSATTPTSTSGSGAGRLQHSPVLFEKEWDAATTQIYQALLTNELLTKVVFNFYETGSGGSETLAFRVTLTNARVVGVRQHVGDTRYDSTLDSRRYEDISLSFQTIKIEDVTGSTTGTVGTLPRRAPANRPGASPVRPPRLTARALLPVPQAR